MISGSYLKQINGDLVFQTRTIFLKWISLWSRDKNVIFKTKFITSLWTQILYLNFKENVGKMICQRLQHIWA